MNILAFASFPYSQHLFPSDFHLTFTFYTAALVRKEIQDETDRITGRTKQISPIPIHLSIYSPNGNKIFDCPFRNLFLLNCENLYVVMLSDSSQSQYTWFHKSLISSHLLIYLDFFFFVQNP